MDAHEHDNPAVEAATAKPEAVDVQVLGKLIEEQLIIMQEAMNRLPDRVIHKTFTGDPAICSAMLTLQAVQEALHGNDWFLRNLAELTPPVM